MWGSWGEGRGGEGGAERECMRGKGDNCPMGLNGDLQKDCQPINDWGRFGPVWGWGEGKSWGWEYLQCL